MKNKKTAWILLPAVLLIWGLLGWKIYAAMKDDAPRAFTNTTPQHSDAYVTVVPDTYQLLLDYPDPFLATQKVPVKHTHTPKSNVVTVPSPPKNSADVSVPWPELRYAGLVQSKDGKMLGFLSVNGQSHFVKANEAIGEITVQKIWKDSALLVRGKERRVVKK